MYPLFLNLLQEIDDTLLDSISESLKVGEGGGNQEAEDYLFGQKFGSPEEEGKKTKIIALVTIRLSL